MAIYDLGTASLAANGEVTGVGTTWKAPLTLIRVGATIVFKTEPVQIYTISEIISDTQVNVYNPNSETVPAGTGYAILAHDGITVQGLAQDVAETLRYYQSRETEIAAAVDAFNNFDEDDFNQKVTSVNTQSQQVTYDAAQVALDRAASESSASSALSSSNSASVSATQAQAAAQSVSGALIGSFQDGVTLNSRTQQILNIYDGIATSYVWAGSLPKDVPANSSPQSTGGVNNDAWIKVSDVSRDAFLKSFIATNGGTITNERQCVYFSDGYWYSWTGPLPKELSSSDDFNDDYWSCVGLLSSYELNDARNFGFVSNMEDAILPIRRMLKNKFVNFYFPPDSVINLSEGFFLRSDIKIDFNGSTINWNGSPFTSADIDNGSEMAIINTPNFAGGTGGSLKNISIESVKVNCEDYAIGLNLRNIDGFSIKNASVNKAQRQGINVSNCKNGKLSGVNIKDCAPLDSSGFSINDVENWGDGIIVWYGSTNISLENFNVESGNGRGGRGGIVVDGYAPPGKPDTRNISVDNCYVYGYDRPFHSELSGLVHVSNSNFEYNTGSDNHRFLQCAVAVWNALDNTVFTNCTFRTNSRFMKNSGAKAIFYGCNIYKTSSTESFFVTGPEEAGYVEFNSCNIYQSGGDWAAHNSSLSFINSMVSSDSQSSINFSSTSVAKSLFVSGSQLIRTSITTQYAPRYTELKFYNSQVSGDVNAGSNCDLYISSCDISGSVTANQILRYSGSMPSGGFSWMQNANQQLSGMWLGSRPPTSSRPDGSGNWRRGDIVLNLDAVEGQSIQFYCVTPGAPGRWSALPALLPAT